MPEAWLAMVRTMDPVEFWLALAGAVIATGVGFWLWRRSFQNARVMEDTPTSKIRSAAQGFVELAGTQDTAMDRTPIAPLSGRPVTWWSYKIEKKERSAGGDGGRKTTWRTVETRTSSNLIRLDDGTGQVVVNPAGAEVTPSSSDTWYGSERKPTRGPGPGGSGLVDWGGMVGTSRRRYRYTEKIMRPGEPLFALGHFETRRGAVDSDERARRRTELLAEWKADPAALAARFDEDGDGRVDMHEWERARAAAEAAVEEQAAREERQPAADLLLKPPDGRPFILSVKDQAELARSYRFRSVAFLALFLVGLAATGVLVTGWFGA